MEPVQNMEEQLWRYIDGELTPDEKSVVDQRIEADAAWKSKYQELWSVHQLLNSSELDAPSLRFTKNVMEEITRLTIAPAGKKYLNTKIIWGISFFFILMLLGTLVYSFGSVNWSAGSSHSAIHDTMQKVDFSQLLNGNWMIVLLSINVILGLFLADQYFSKKRKQYRQEA